MAEGIWIFNCCGLCAHEGDDEYCSTCIHGEHPYHDNKVLYFNHFLNKGDESFDIESEDNNE